MNQTEITHNIGDRVLVLHNIPLGNLIGTVTAINYNTYEVTLDGGGKDNMFGFQLQPLPDAPDEEDLMIDGYMKLHPDAERPIHSRMNA